jgi:hypothetical protein
VRLDEWQLRPGEPIQEGLEKGLRESDIVAFVVTPQSDHRSVFSTPVVLSSSLRLSVFA